MKKIQIKGLKKCHGLTNPQTLEALEAYRDIVKELDMEDELDDVIVLSFYD